VHPLLRLPWALAGACADTAAALLPPGAAKWQRAITARRDSAAEWRAQAARRDPSRPLAWFHAPSVGEGLQALPVVQRLQRLEPPPQVATTWFSPSAAPFAARFGADLAGYLPFDSARGARRVLDAIRPSALVYAKVDVWPTLTAMAATRGVPLGMIAATLRPDSGRSGLLARALLRDAYAALDLVGAISAEDAERLLAIGVRHEALRVTGDSRYDQVWERAQRPPTDQPWRQRLADERPTLVAGSTWPADESVLLPAWLTLRQSVPGARLILAPHEPTETHLAPLRSWAESAGLRLATLDAAEVAAADVVLIDRVGVLGDCYGLATAAFVGGGFHAAGLHSVLEPAAFGVPVLFGPQHVGNRDALRLIAAAGGAGVTDAATLSAALIGWLGDRVAAQSNGRAAQRVVEAERGAADRALALVHELLVAA
jgi:3-deoxy-D-manno-octulosonic-acid transferase